MFISTQFHLTTDIIEIVHSNSRKNYVFLNDKPILQRIFKRTKKIERPKRIWNAHKVVNIRKVESCEINIFCVVKCDKLN